MSAYRPVPISGEHDVSSFCCGGEESLDQFLVNEALTAHGRGASRTHVWADDEAHVVAYYTLFPTSVTPKAAKALPSKIRSGFNSSDIPGFTIGKLALDQSLRGNNLGGDLLVDALASVVSAADQVGGRVILVTAVDNPAFEFYERAGFEGIAQSYDMWMQVATAREALDGLRTQA